METDNDSSTSYNIEKEDLGEQKNTKPFDPSKIRIDHQNINIGTIIEMLQFEEIDLMPDFQRKAGLWDKVKKSRLIESILLGLPLPSFYFSVSEKTGKWSVVDGLQRLSTFNEFLVKKTLVLSGLEFLKEYETKKYADFNRDDVRKISSFKINLHVIDKETPHNVKFLIFKRVNTVGLELKPQEIRHALNQGKPAIFIKELSELEAFKKATNYKIKSDRQENRDYVNRFIAFYLCGYEDNYKGELDTFLNDGMAMLDSKNENELEKIKKAFENSMKISYLLFEEEAFRKKNKDSKRLNPISKSIFDTISVNLGWIQENQYDLILKNKDYFLNELSIGFNNRESEFFNSISTGTGQKGNVKIRFQFVKNIIKKIIKNDYTIFD